MQERTLKNAITYIAKELENKGLKIATVTKDFILFEGGENITFLDNGKMIAKTSTAPSASKTTFYSWVVANDTTVEMLQREIETYINLSGWHK